MSASHLDAFGALMRLLDTTSSAAGSIRKACLAVEDCIVNNRDNLRAFFDMCFPTLLKKVFGYDDYGASWLNVVAKPGRESDAQALVELLSPSGRLFIAILRADDDQLVQFIFPLERLPGHTQELLRTAAGRQELERWPQYRGHMSLDAQGHAHVHLEVFEYFMFWNAFYVLRGSRSGSAEQQYSAPGGQQLNAHKTDTHWGKSLHDLKRTFITGFHGAASTALHVHPYFTLLSHYLSHFLPRGGQCTNLGSVLLSILVEFWLTDVAEPVPSEVTQPDASSAAAQDNTSASPRSLNMGSNMMMMTPLGAGNPAGTTTTPGVLSRAANNRMLTSSPLRLLSYQPPSEELLAGITLLVQHVTIADARVVAGLAGSRDARGLVQPVHVRSPWLVETPVKTMVLGQSRAAGINAPMHVLGAPASPAVQALSRKVYRFLRRTIAQWPLSSGNSLLPTIHLWLSILTPWSCTGFTSSSGTGAHVTRSTSGSLGGALEAVGQVVMQGRPGVTPGSGQKLQSTMSHLGSEISHRLHLSRGGHEPGALDSLPPVSPYTPEWRGHVLAHLPFYCILIPRFLELAYARIDYQGEAAVTEALLVVRALAGAGQGLVDLLKQVEESYCRFQGTNKRQMSGPFADLLPWLVEQATDWEAAAVTGAPTKPPLQADPSFKLFRTDASSAAFFGEAVYRAAERKVGAQLSDALLHNLRAVLPVDLLHSTPKRPATEAGTSSRYPPPGVWAQVQYKGDPLTRPIASNEIGVLVRVTVLLSRLINSLLGLDQPWLGEHEEPPETVVQQSLAGLRRKGFRVSLRFLAEIQVVAWLVGLVTLGTWLSRVVSA